MIKLKSLWKSPENQIYTLGWGWMMGLDTLQYITGDIVQITEQEAENYADAVNELYQMYITAAQYVIDNQLFNQLAIPENIVEMIKYTWEDDRHLHLYGRFDLSGGTDNQPIKLIEFNSDTATCIPETAVIQWAHLKANQLDETLQFNSLYDLLKENFIRLREANSDLTPTLLISTMKDFPEDDTNVEVLGEAAQEAGFEVDYCHIEDVHFSPEDGIFTRNHFDNYYRYDFWFKLVPWEYIAYDEPELMNILNKIVMNRKAVVINPAYNILFQSKGILKVLWDLFPQHPLLLETSDTILTNKEYCVEKVLFGREGANVKILDRNSQTMIEKQGEYGEYPKIYQEYVEFLRDYQGNCYQAGVFFAYEAAALGFRRGGRIIDNTAQFTGHLIS
ncbi:MAG: glutathionylspermidine synthase family protein [Thermoflexibacter sp.]|jgi:glutathionylspermidine synthase|nr:glutathionylspermidine synthase family protein [Thermoflexibacter sp.]